MNRHERRYRWGVRALKVLIALWAASMLVFWALPASVWKRGPTMFIIFGIVVALLMVAALVLNVIMVVSYWRWTGHHPFSSSSDRWRDEV
jgi:hypothetical protein